MRVPDSPLGDDPVFPNRPDHRDFALLSSIILQMDGQAAEDAGFDLAAAIASSVDSGSLIYMATQRAYRVVGAETKRDVLANLDTIAALTAVWVEAFLVGARFTERSL